MKQVDDSVILLGCGFFCLSVLLAWGISTLVIWAGWNRVISPVFSLSELSFWQAALLGSLLSLVGSCFKGIMSVEKS